MKILWAFDPFEENVGLQKMGLSLIKKISTARSNVTAVHVRAESREDLAVLLSASGRKRSMESAEDLIKNRIRKLGLKQISARTLDAPTLSQTDAVKSFAAFAEKRGDLVVLPTHAREGVKRLVLGSFAETIVHYSKTDLLLFNPKAKLPSGSPRTLLYCHDFSRQGEAGLKSAIRYAKEWDATLHVVHIPRPVFSVHFEGQDEGAERYRKQVRGRMKKLEERMQKEGVSHAVSLETGWKPVGEMILNASRRSKADFVLVVAKSGRLAALIGGSVTRYLLRHSQIPVLVMKCS